MSNLDHFPQLLLPKDHVSSKTRCLIEELSSTEVQVELKRPAYELKIVADENEKPLKIELKVELPGVNSVSLCDLSVSEVGWIDNTVHLYQSVFTVLCWGNQLHNLSGLRSFVQVTCQLGLLCSTNLAHFVTQVKKQFPSHNMLFSWRCYAPQFFFRHVNFSMACLFLLTVVWAKC